MCIMDEQLVVSSGDIREYQEKLDAIKDAMKDYGVWRGDGVVEYYPNTGLNGKRAVIVSDLFGTPLGDIHPWVIPYLETVKDPVSEYSKTALAYSKKIKSDKSFIDIPSEQARPAHKLYAAVVLAREGRYKEALETMYSLWDSDIGTVFAFSDAYREFIKALPREMYVSNGKWTGDNRLLFIVSRYSDIPGLEYTDKQKLVRTFTHAFMGS